MLQNAASLLLIGASKSQPYSLSITLFNYIFFVNYKRGIGMREDYAYGMHEDFAYGLLLIGAPK
jgi:hypothetical protein